MPSSYEGDLFLLYLTIIAGGNHKLARCGKTNAKDKDMTKHNAYSFYISQCSRN